MAAFKKIMKDFKNEHILLFFGLVFLIFVLYQYSNGKNTFQYGMTSMNNSSSNSNSKSNSNMTSSLMSSNTGSVIGAGVPNTYAPYNGSTEIKPPTSMTELNKPIANPSDLLPSNSNSWSNMNPVNNLQNVNLLNPVQIVGINTQGTSLRNANLQIRNEPSNPRLDNIGPWNISTIEPDKFAKGLDIGSPASNM